ncbi:hypothetical protein N658DRAFT_48423 [Parathielavia hyrcaniae]|uniref:Uncharacterized protein n=1 Tax=Parathielavia hyrcaniae TaxID=113614 RepID=A0AAN6T276_9PEZI|nr:hypothetical protein N658DRAFT_48423 [Parathielavia hyrcaniae]
MAIVEDSPRQSFRCRICPGPPLRPGTEPANYGPIEFNARLLVSAGPRRSSSSCFFPFCFLTLPGLSDSIRVWLHMESESLACATPTNLTDSWQQLSCLPVLRDNPAPLKRDSKIIPRHTSGGRHAKNGLCTESRSLGWDVSGQFSGINSHSVAFTPRLCCTRPTLAHTDSAGRAT